MCSCSVLGLVTHRLALLRPREVNNWHNEKAVRCIGNTSEGIVPCQEGSEKSKIATCLVAAFVWSCRSVLEIPDRKQQEGHIEGEEEEEEGHGRFQRANEQNEREDEPALTRISTLLPA